MLDHFQRCLVAPSIPIHDKQRASSSSWPWLWGRAVHPASRVLLSTAGNSTHPGEPWKRTDCISLGPPRGSPVPFLPRCEGQALLRETWASLAVGDRGGRWVILILGSSPVVLFLPGVSDTVPNIVVREYLMGRLHWKILATHQV